MKDPLETLIGQSIPVPELDEEESTNILEDASLKFDVEELLKSIGTKEFRYIYDHVIPVFKKESLEFQRKSCQDILLKIEEVFNFQPIENVDFDNLKDIYQVYDLIKFLHFGYIDFLINYWKEFDIKDLSLITLNKQINNITMSDITWEVILNKVIKDFPIENKLVLNFLMNTEGTVLKNFILDNTRENLIVILVEILKQRIPKEESKNEEDSNN